MKIILTKKSSSTDPYRKKMSATEAVTSLAAIIVSIFRLQSRINRQHEYEGDDIKDIPEYPKATQFLAK